MRLGQFKHLKERNIVRNWVTLSRWIRDHEFPRPFKPTARTTLFDLDEVDRWLETRRQQAADKKIPAEQPAVSPPLSPLTPPSEQPAKRGRGRPKGSKNRPKATASGG